MEGIVEAGVGIRSQQFDEHDKGIIGACRSIFLL
jgi:hypothetical protein